MLEGSVGHHIGQRPTDLWDRRLRAPKLPVIQSTSKTQQEMCTWGVWHWLELEWGCKDSVQREGPEPFLVCQMTENEM